MQAFSKTGEHHSDLWLVNGSPEFAQFPGGIVPGIDQCIPIYLKVGNYAYGEVHIRERHSKWVKTQGFNSVPELVHHKLGHTGEIYSTETETKLKIVMRLKPSALLFLEQKDHPSPHLSVTTIYFHQGYLDGTKIGRYPGRR